MSRPPLRDAVLSLGLLLLAWQLLVWASGVPHFILPGPLRVFRALFAHAELLAAHTWVTALEVAVGLLLGSVLGAATALYLLVANAARRLLLPLLVLSQTVPVFALAPLLTLWLGYGMGAKIAMTLLMIYFPVTSTFFDGLRNTPQGYLELAHSMRATAPRLLFFVRLPAALPSLASGIRLAAVYAPIGAVIGEWVGASQGLGYLMLLANGRVQIDLLFAALLTLCGMTVLLHASIDLLCRRIDRWSGQTA